MVFMRGDAAITIAPWLAIRLGGDWGDASLDVPDGRGRNELPVDASQRRSVKLAICCDVPTWRCRPKKNRRRNPRDRGDRIAKR